MTGSEVPKPLAGSRLPYEPHIDGLRAVAVLAVIVFHAFPVLLPGGYVGVDIFFVISGYLITRIILSDIEGGAFSFSQFYSRRIRRIFPALSLVLATSLLFGWIVLLPGEWESLGQNASAAAFFISNFVFMNASGYFDAPAESNPFLHLWSLAIEEQFYLAWPFLLMIVYRVRNRAYWLLTAVAAASFLSFYFIENRDVAFFSTVTRVWELTVGGVLAWAHSFPREPSGRFLATAPLLEAARALLPTVGLILIVVSVVWLDKTTPYPGAAALMPTVGAAFVILGGAGAAANRSFLSAPLIVAVGLISYPLYLWHWPLLAFANILDPKAATILIRLALVSVAVVLSVATYRLLELPIRRAGPIGIVALFYSIGALGVTGYYAQLGRLEPYSINQPGILVAAAAQTDWDFPPRSLVPLRTSDSMFYGRAGANPGVVFIGDSNVQQFAPRVDAIVESAAGRVRSVLFATRGGCLPIRGATLDSRPDCETFLDDALAAASSSDVSAVVIGAAWHSYFMTKNSYYFKSADGSRQPIILGGPGAGNAFSSLASMIREIRGAGKDVFLVLNIPVGREFDPATNVTRPFVGQFFRASQTAKSRQEVELTLAGVNERLAEVASIAGAQILDPVESLCGRDSCSQFDTAGTPRFKDATHLRASYVRREVGFLDSNLLIKGR